MIWTAQDLGRLWELMKRPKNFLLVDAIEQSPVAQLVAERRWARGGFRTRELGPAARVSMALPAVMVHSSGDTGAADLATDWMEKKGPDNFKIVQWEANQGMRFEGTLLPRFLNPLPGRSTTVNVIGFNRKTVPQTDLPLTFTVAANGAGDIGWFVDVDARCSNEAMPAPGCFRLQRHAGPVEVDIVPDPAGDYWQLRLGGSVTDVEQIPKPYSPFENDPPQRIAVVFDRTCPDSTHWADARDLMSPQLQRRSGFETEPSKPDYGEFNGELRSALRKALVQKLGRTRHLDVFYFGDSVEGGVSNDYTVPQPNCGMARSVSPPFDEKTIERFEGLLSYCPGLDVWDPLQQALGAAWEHLKDSPERFGILIVGNSPPDYPTGESPLQEIADVFGFPTSYRRQSAQFHHVLQLCAQEAVPIVYLFLTQQSYGVEQSGFQEFRQLETVVHRALEKCMKVISRDATADEAQKGIAEAIDYLDNPGPPKSAVRILS